MGGAALTQSGRQARGPSGQAWRAAQRRNWSSWAASAGSPNLESINPSDASIDESLADPRPRWRPGPPTLVGCAAPLG
eukprot:5948528-Alexandrium_andersonii.AAC.1